MHDPGAYFGGAREAGRYLLQEGVALLDRYRPGGGHHGLELGIC
jgi:hypothetical protein